MSAVIDFFANLFESSFMPHGHCFMWKPDILWLHVISDAVVALSYFSIPVALVVLYRRRTDLNYSHVLTLFAAFIFLCGLTHVLGIWTMWDPIYRAEGVVKGATAVVSVLTASALWPMIPRILAIPNPAELSTANDALRTQIDERRLAEERFRSLLEAAPDAMVIVDAGGSIELVNARCESLFGYAREALIGQAIEMLVPEAAREAHVLQRNGYMANAAPKPMGAGRELFGLRSDGTEFPVEISLSPLDTHAGMVVTAAIRDISDRIDVQNRLRDLNEELSKRVDDRTAELARRAEELERSNRELEQFAYVVSHDLKSPMRGIASLSQFLAEDQRDRLDAEGREQLAMLTERVGRMHNMIDGVLDYSRAATHPVEAERLDVSALVHEVIESIDAPPSIAIEVGELTEVSYPRVQLHQIFQNLISNAIRHMGADSGTVRVSADRVRDHVEFRVADDGVGIAPEHHERVFLIFQTLAARSGEDASGLGLAIVKKIVERNGGRIYLESRRGHGTTFTFTVPS